MFYLAFVLLLTRLLSAHSAEAQDVEDRLLEVVQKTIDLGADINATNRGGDTPLHLAAYVALRTVCSSLLTLTRSLVRTVRDPTSD
jgi:ankyrin repeat protein